MESAQESLGDPDLLDRLKGRISISGDDLSQRSLDSTEPPPHHPSTELADILVEIKDLDLDDPLTSDWDTDPFEVDPESTAHYIECYFNYINDSLFYIFPRRQFMAWLQSCRTRTLDDKMLLYAMMTLGGVFSDHSDRFMVMKRNARTARYAVEHSQHELSLQLAQSRIVLALWYFAVGALVKSWDAIGAAIRTVCGLRYNLESGGIRFDPSQVCEFGLQPPALIECRRRTFWMAFLLDVSSSLHVPCSVIRDSSLFSRFHKIWLELTTQNK